MALLEDYTYYPVIGNSALSRPGVDGAAVATDRRDATTTSCAGPLRRGNRVRCDGLTRLGIRHLDCQRAIADQYSGAGFQPNAEMFTEQQRLETGAVDKKVAFNQIALPRF